MEIKLEQVRKWITLVFIGKKSAEKVAVLCQGTEVYGVATVIKLMAVALPDLLFICMVQGPLVDWLRSRNMHVVVIDRQSEFVASRQSLVTLFRLPGVVLKLAKNAKILEAVLVKHGIGILHTHWLPQQIMSGFLRRKGYRTVWHIHNNMNKGRLMGLGQKFNHLMAKWGADVIVPVSRYIGSDWSESGVSLCPILNAALPLTDERKKEAVCNEHVVDDIEDNEASVSLRCVAAGRLVEDKGLHVAIEAVGKARRSGADVVLDIYGGPLDDNNAYANFLRQMIRDKKLEKFVRLMGFEDQLRDKCVEYDLGMQCRISPEPCSIWVCESICDGLPLIASRTGGTPELVKNGQTGWLYSPGSVEEVSVLLLKIASNRELLNLARNELVIWSKNFQVDRFAKDLLSVYGQFGGKGEGIVRRTGESGG